MNDSPADLIEAGAKTLGVTQKELAAMLGLSKQALSKFKRTRIPAERVLDFERVTGISRTRWRPDVYPAVVAA
jgi:DNA-binding transcriptional regulator YdaS (Cro superfamily)